MRSICAGFSVGKTDSIPEERVDLSGGYVSLMAMVWITCDL
jgi:hypothetical protein